MLFFFRSGLLLGRVMVAAGLVVMTVALAASSSEVLFLAENQAAMEKMMTGMKATPSGDVDHDCIAMMIPHHQGAIDMAQAELRYGHNEQLRRLAQEIIVAQQQEIAAMRLAVGEPLPPSTAAPDQVQGAAPMSIREGGASELETIDYCCAERQRVGVWCLRVGWGGTRLGLCSRDLG